MNYEAAISLARQRMREIGKQPGEYHYEVVFVVGTAEERAAGLIQLNAFNQYYYLINWEWYYGFEICSDGNYFNLSDFTQNTLEEFTGVISIKKNQAYWSIAEGEYQFPVQFLRVSIF